MNLAEDIDWINSQLEKSYGSELIAGNLPRFRVVFSDEQFEKRWVTKTDEGFDLLHPEVRLVPKYITYINAKYVLERLIPTMPDTDLVEKTSYEPCWTFVDISGHYLPPRFDMCCVIIDSLFAQMNKANGFAKYKDPEVNPEHRLQAVDKMYKELFGNETDTADALRYKEGVVNPAGKENFLDSTVKENEVKH